ncbi:1-deoxy-D-xylulose-5-phosphate synthase [Candidatus Photodesmus katoptron]|uniref:1-deoxy-D-xylulose-5-phosphate synthase n=1 Tax=Candidatus Photodesmus katoptron Akat1 TaxID=1236703 RepID=S3DJP6_9GAMM|nr:1-deoxy-D-xylulose-5-phosphate synthase [Candidatus Photodesmus katoptron]EPE37364.1 1-deoxy-D-xylulose-5-phosphate synthase [Candidatus Photodesmus katoptron Akat1]KEY90772.1 1-deoxy-D-xylulose-5-phosphate synthase [Candidatus Photodesmus katoptron]
MTLDISKYPILSLANTPRELRSLKKELLPQLCDELRIYLLNSVSQSSGHLASGLGTVELTVALHYIYETPFDRLIWDIGHQAYPHKILTNRRHQMATIRKKNGLHPFPWREESEYDTLSVGHSSTSISAALGMAITLDKEGKDRKVVSVIGDGSITAGIAFEAMNHAGDVHPNMLIILNDNEMSISKNVGGLNKYLTQLLSGNLYTSIKEGGKKVLSGIPPIKELARRTEEHIKGMIIPGTLFEELGFNYIGPIDGHNISELVKTIKKMRDLKGPQFLHVITKKGKGYKPAEKDPISYHGVPKFDLSQTTLPENVSKKQTFSEIFGDFLCDMATLDPKLMAITPAMCEGSGMVRFSKEFPQRYFDVAIAEQHAITLATGMAIAGDRPIVSIYSTFLQRGYDQLIHDVAIMNLPIMFAIDRSGLVGSDGETHQGAFDLSFIRCIPNMTIMAPSDENECRHMLYTAYKHNAPSAVRYPRGYGMGTQIQIKFSAFEIGKGRIIRKGNKIAVLNFGTLLKNVLKVADKLNTTVADMRFIKPLDEKLIVHLIENHDMLVTIEDNVIAGGAGSAVVEYMMKEKLIKPVLNLGLPDRFIAQGTQEELHQELDLDPDGIEKAIRDYLVK